tara:strand:- start:170 stop:1162 length:993 start_codon:yes stop_codon:yes gene_type:complete
VATYYDIFGQKVQYLSSDPSDVQTGQVWYNSTSNTAKVRAATTTGVWSAGGTYPLNGTNISGAGPQTAAIAFGARVYPGPNGPSNVSNTYDGSSWTATPPINTSRGNAGSAKNGSQTAALMIAGNNGGETNVCEEYNGSTWASVNNYPVSAREHDQGTGIQTLALCSAGYTGSYITTTCTYDGTNWTALGSPSNMNASRFSGTTVGTQTAAVMFGGTSPSGPGLVESWNGSTWSEEAASLNTPRNAGGSAGTSTNAVFFGGEPTGNGAATETWDGTSFATTGSMATPRYSMASNGTALAALCTGGSGAGENTTEEFTGAGALETQTITTS